MPDISSVFSADGALARNVPGYAVRAQQHEMAQAIADAIAANSILVAEAGTGTGKTFAYLVPSLLAGGKVIISTGTKTLQDQLFNRDIPTVRAALKAPVTVALLKGRANYVCHYHLERMVQDERPSLVTRDEVKYLKLIERYAVPVKPVTKAASAKCLKMPPSGSKSLLLARIAWARNAPVTRTALSWRPASRRSWRM